MDDQQETEITLGIETSCDETAAAVVTAHGDILSNIITSQQEAHRLHGGVVPEIAARAHLSLIDTVISQAIDEAGIGYEDLSCVAATGGPGLIGGVLVGTVAAKAIAAGRGIPYYAINHLEGHALTARLTEQAGGGLRFPYLLLLVSGGHTQLLNVRGVGDYHCYGTTIDDAAGEAFDKSAKLLGLDPPNGPALESLAKGGDDNRYNLPRPLSQKSGCDFSFSGLKTAVRTVYEKEIESLIEPSAVKLAKKDLAASLERAIADCLTMRSQQAMRIFQSTYPDLGFTPNFVVAGGVGANQRVRAMLAEVAKTEKFNFSAPPIGLCTDNAVMIAWAGIERRGAGLASDGFDFTPRPRWPLDEETMKDRRRQA